MSDPLQLVGTTIAEKYAVESVVGEGGFAIVYKASHLIWKRPVAIKAFKSMGSFAAKDRERLLDEFVREGALLAELSERSAAICQARDVGTITTPSGAWAPYMVLEWLEGVTLERALVDERAAGMAPRTVQQAIALLEPVGEALALAHTRGIAHRDVKPGNIFLLGQPRSESCTVKLLDFGIAKVVQDAQKMAGAFSQTSGQVTSFTPAYGAPEQFSRAQGATGPWTDVFALALIFGELVSGKEPLPGDDVAQLAFASMDPSRRPTPRTLGAQVSDQVEAVIAKALAVPIQQRYQTAGELWNALRAAVGLSPMRAITGNGAQSQPIVPSGDLPLASQAATASLASASRTTGGAGKSSRTGLVLGVVGALAVAGIGGFLATRHGDAPAPVAAAPAPSAPPSATAPPKPAAPTCPAGMVLIPAGKFFMGSDDKSDFPFERPAHQVTLAPFCIDTYEVTVARYKACSDKGECKRAGITNEWEKITDDDHKAFDPLCNVRDPDEKAKHPINCVDWEMADTFCKAAAPRGRLPREAEWEFATRGSDGRKFPWGDDWPDAKHLNACDKDCLAWGKKNHVEEKSMYEASDGYANTAPVGSFPLGDSPFGLADVVGNVWEWTSDWYAPYTAAAQTNPVGPDAEADGDGKVIRGGAWNGAYPAWVRPTFRYHDAPTKRSYGIGFRCAADLAAP
ncbi:MAG: bifunctional serine/threonine-protein kinase/formylglycine-generating enzyme family protein [Polyangiaceae bacterium]